MEIKIKVNVDDIYQEDGETFEESFNQHIRRQVKTDIWKQIKDEVERQIAKEAKAVVQREYEMQIREEVKKIIETGFVPGTSSKNNEEGERISHWIASQFHKSHGWNSPKDFLEKKSKQFAEEMKKRYDHLFASQVVLKLNQQGLLKDGVVDTLIESKNN